MNVQEKVFSIVINQLGIKEEDIKLESSFIDNLGADSLDGVELAMRLEEEFGIEIPDEEMEKLETVDQVIEYVKKMIGAK